MSIEILSAFSDSFSALCEQNPTLADHWISECYDHSTGQWNVTENHLKKIQKDVENNC